MNTYSISYTECDVNEENIFKNITAIDPLLKLNLMSQIIESYYKFHNYTKTPYDLELELRKRNLNVGLVAVDWTKNETYLKNVESGLGKVVLKNKYSKYLGSGLDFEEEDLAVYAVFISCRPRKYVIEEILSHSSTLEENLEKLKKSGDFIIYDEKKNSVLNDDVQKVDKNDFNTMLQEGRLLLTVKSIDAEEIFTKCCNENPGAKLELFSLLPDGSPLTVLTLDNKIICDIGVNIYFKDGKKCMRYMSVNQQY